MKNLDNGKTSDEKLKPINRILLVIFITIILFIILGIGSAMPLSEEEAKQLMEQFKDLARNLSMFKIFMNNFTVALLSFIPFIGVGIMGFVIFQTGKFLGYISNQSGIHPALLILFTIITVYGLIEFLGYGVAVSEGIIFSYLIVKKKFRSEIKWLLISIGITAALLLAAAALETFLVTILKGFIPASAGI